MTPLDWSILKRGEGISFCHDTLSYAVFFVLVDVYVNCWEVVKSPLISLLSAVLVHQTLQAKCAALYIHDASEIFQCWNPFALLFSI